MNRRSWVITRVEGPIQSVAVMSLDPAALDSIARCLSYLTRLSGVAAAECLSMLEEYSQPLRPEDRVQVLLWFAHLERTPSSLH